MGSNNYHREFKASDCANCGKKESATMGVMINGGFAYVCSSVCETRLYKRIENGMLKAENIVNQPIFNPLSIPPDDPRLYSMRTRIKQLKNEIKQVQKASLKTIDALIVNYENFIKTIQ